MRVSFGSAITGCIGCTGKALPAEGTGVVDGRVAGVEALKGPRVGGKGAYAAVALPAASSKKEPSSTSLSLSESSVRSTTSGTVPESLVCQ